MRPRIVLTLVLLLVVTSGSAASKVATYRVTINGPAMTEPAVIHDRPTLDRISLALLSGSAYSRIEPPEIRGQAYRLAYAFGIGDEAGSSTAVIHQALYPFAVGGPVVFTPRQRIETTYGPVYFARGWFKVPRRIVRELRAAGLPATAPDIKTAPSAASLASEESSLTWPWFAGLGTALGAFSVATSGYLRRRRRSSI